jgi:hypothetical protein
MIGTLLYYTEKGGWLVHAPSVQITSGKRVLGTHWRGVSQGTVPKRIFGSAGNQNPDVQLVAESQALPDTDLYIARYAMLCVALII